jgi:hypothetical protein
MKFTPSFLLLISLIGSIKAFHSALPSPVSRAFPRTSLFSSSGQGFGAPPPPPKKRDPEQQEQTSSPVVAENSQPPLNAGQKALQEMRRQQAEERDAQLRKLRDMLEMDATSVETPTAIPEKVATRMGQRMIGFVGIPLFLGLGSFVLFWYLATYQGIEIEPIYVAATTIILLAVGLLGITYSIFSTSWDEDRQGSLLGLEEAATNVDRVKEGLGRSQENTVLREKIKGMSKEELSQVLADLERRENQQKNQP